MELWASKYGDQATFLCVCVEGKGIAKRFGGRYSVNAYLENDGPKFPAQLGCQGFTILNAAGAFLEIRTRSWNEYRDVVFREVEGYLASQNCVIGAAVEKTVASRHPVGRAVQVFNLDPSVDGLVGTVAVVHSDGLYAITLEDRSTLAAEDENLVRAGPLEAVAHDEMDAEHATLVKLLSLACRSPSKSNIAAVRDCFAAHARHEEELLAPLENGGFSVLKTHAADHARILRLADAAASDLAPKAIQSLVNAIYEHADNFDAKYAGKI